MVSPVREEVYAITCSRLFTLILKEIPPGNSIERVYIAIYVYVREISFTEFIIPNNKVELTRRVQPQEKSNKRKSTSRIGLNIYI